MLTESTKVPEVSGGKFVLEYETEFHVAFVTVAVSTYPLLIFLILIVSPTTNGILKNV